MLKMGKEGPIKKSAIAKGVVFIGLLIVCIVAIVLVANSTRNDKSPTGQYSSAAASSDGSPCAQIAVDILELGGTAADAAISGMLCSGVVNPHSMGLGGGFFLTYYSRTEGRAYTLNAREVAPAAATEDMYEGDGDLSTKGGLAVAVPGELRGYRAMYSRFGGGVTWAQVLEPSIRLCEQGHPISWHLANAIDEHREDILAEPSFSFLVDPETEDVYQEGDVLYLRTLGATIRQLQDEPDALYTGSLARVLVEDLNTFGSIITEEDMAGFTAEWMDPIKIRLQNKNMSVYSVAPPASGAILAFILNVLDGYDFDSESLSPENALLTYQRITETFKYAYAERTYLGDPAYVDISKILEDLTSEKYARETRDKILEDATSQDPAYYGAFTMNPPDSGTSHLSVLSAAGDAAAITSTINTYFGAMVASSRTGIIFNNEMDDFSSPNITNYFEIPPSPANFIRPGKRPLSSMCPAVVVADNGDVRLVVGAAGGTKITTAVSLTTMNNLWFGRTLEQAITDWRIHHQLMPMEVVYENGFNEDVILGLENFGHTIQNSSGLAVVGAVSREDCCIYANADFRKAGGVDGY